MCTLFRFSVLKFQMSNNNQAEVRRRGSTREVSSATPVREVHRSPSLNIERSTFVMQIKVEIVLELFSV